MTCTYLPGADKSLARTGGGKKLGSMSGTRAISTKSRRELSSSSSPPPPHDKATKEIHAILTETLISFLPDRAKDLSVPLYNKVLPQLLCSNSIIIHNKSYLNIFCPAVVLLLVSHTGF